MTAGASGNLTNLLDLGDAWGSLHPQFRIVLLKGLEHRLPLHRILPCPVAPVACLGAQNVSGLERVRTRGCSILDPPLGQPASKTISMVA